MAVLICSDYVSVLIRSWGLMMKIKSFGPCAAILPPTKLWPLRGDPTSKQNHCTLMYLCIHNARNSHNYILIATMHVLASPVVSECRSKTLAPAWQPTSNQTNTVDRASIIKSAKREISFWSFPGQNRSAPLSIKLPGPACQLPHYFQVWF